MNPLLPLASVGPWCPSRYCDADVAPASYSAASLFTVTEERESEDVGHVDSAMRRRRATPDIAAEATNILPEVDPRTNADGDGDREREPDRERGRKSDVGDGRPQAATDRDELASIRRQCDSTLVAYMSYFVASNSIISMRIRTFEEILYGALYAASMEKVERCEQRAACNVEHLCTSINS